MNDTYEPTAEEQHAYDMASRGYIGYDKPKIQHIKDNTRPLSEQEILQQEGDYLRTDNGF